MKESDIRRTDILARYQELSLRDGQKMDPSAFVPVPCPGCGGASTQFKFEKNTFSFIQCIQCGSVFCSPRPSQAALDEFYEKGASSDYWAKVFFPSVAEARREKLFRKKAEAIGRLMADRGTQPRSICDAGAGHGIFLEELQKVFPDASLHAIEPGPSMAATCRDKGFETIETYAEQATAWQGRFDLVISSEVIEHVFSPETFVSALLQLAKPGGAVLLTGLGYEGFDILVLQEKSKSVFPPHHINFLSIRGFEALFERLGFRDVEIWTPGELDVDIVLNSGYAPEFLEVLCRRRGMTQQLQELLKAAKLSSHVWALARRPTA